MSKTNWRTPPDLFNLIHKAIEFKVDAAADSSNHLLPDYYGQGGVEEDALGVEKWLSPTWCNPPYGRGKEWLRWMSKFVEQSLKGVDIVALIPASVGSRWWNDYVVQPGADIIFLTGRVPFIDFKGGKLQQVNGTPFDSALVFYGPNTIGGSTSWLDWKRKLADKSSLGNAVEVDVYNQTDQGTVGEDHGAELPGTEVAGSDGRPPLSLQSTIPERHQPDEPGRLPPPRRDLSDGFPGSVDRWDPIRSSLLHPPSKGSL